MEPLISVIVPIYKVEKYLRQCVDSILAQTYTNLEIILVDDGSPDNCGAICDEYSAKDSRIIVIHKPNGGVSDARNAGLKVATGEYITFVDSDDWLDLDSYERLLPYLCESEILLFKLTRETNRDNKTITARGTMNTIVTEIRCCSESYYDLKPLIMSSEMGYMCNKIFHKSVIKGLRFLPLIIGEDLCFCLDAFEKCNHLRCVNISVYHYYMNEAGAVRGASVNNIYSFILLSERIGKGITGLSRKQNIELFNIIIQPSILDLFLRDIMGNKLLTLEDKWKYYLIICEQYDAWRKIDITYCQSRIMKVVIFLQKIRAYRICFNILNWASE